MITFEDIAKVTILGMSTLGVVILWAGSVMFCKFAVDLTIEAWRCSQAGDDDADLAIVMTIPMI